VADPNAVSVVNPELTAAVVQLAAMGAHYIAGGAVAQALEIVKAIPWFAQWWGRRSLHGKVTFAGLLAFGTSLGISGVFHFDPRQGILTATITGLTGPSIAQHAWSFAQSWLVNAFQARAYFAWSIEVNSASAMILYYLVQHLYRHTHTAEEGYYNVLRVLRTKQWIFDEDQLLAGFQNQPGATEANNRELMATSFHGYASDGSSNAVRFLDGGWLTDPKPGNVWWLLFKSRWFSTGSGAVNSLSDCWNKWWAPPTMQAGGVGDTCNPEAPGEAPSQDEVAVTAYLLTGKPDPFSTGKKLLPRWTWNDGH
jgi:hypothetical protein